MLLTSVPVGGDGTFPKRRPKCSLIKDKSTVPGNLGRAGLSVPLFVSTFTLLSV